MEKTQKIISTLYLAVSDRREAVLESIIKNVLFQFDDHVTFSEIYELIEDEFQLSPIQQELTEAISQLKAQGSILSDGDRYALSSEEKSLLNRGRISLKEIEESRFQKFSKRLSENSAISDDDIKRLWEKFNEYIYECFLEDGKSAISSFLAFKEDDIIGERKRIIDLLNKGLSNELQHELHKVIREYPSYIDSKEIEYLDSIAEKAEYFFSLGLDKKTYEYAVEVRLQNLSVFADTNVLFSILDIADSPQQSAVSELTAIARSTDIGYRIRVLPISIAELNNVKNYLKETLNFTEFRPGHIKALLESGDLDEYAHRYYQKKLKDSQAVNPIYVLEDNRTILRSRGVEVYNRKFDFFEDEDFIQAKIKEYYEFESIVNKVRHEKGLPPKVKSEAQVRHDILLREGIKYLRSQTDGEHELKYIAITLDNQLLKFDRFQEGKRLRRESSIIQPNFISPSNFLRRIRAFLPVESDDYKRAFIQAMTNLAPLTGSKERSIEIQRTMSYFHRIGVQDENAILNIVKNELLYSQLKSIDDEGQRDIFLQSAVDKYLEEYKFQIKEFEQKAIKQRNENKASLERTKEEKQELANELEAKNNALLKQSEKVDNLSQRLEEVVLELAKSKFENRKREFVTSKWNDHETYARSGFWPLVRMFFFFLVIGVLAVFVKEKSGDINLYFDNPNASLYLIVGITVLSAVALFIRTYGDKTLIQKSVQFYWSRISKSSKEKYYRKMVQEFENEYDSGNKNPKQ